MNRLEEVLLEQMTVRRWCVAVAIGAMLFGSVGYYAGRQEVTNEVGAAVAETTTKLNELEAWGRKFTAEKKAQQEQAARREGGR